MLTRKVLVIISTIISLIVVLHFVRLPLFTVEKTFIAKRYYGIAIDSDLEYIDDIEVNITGTVYKSGFRYIYMGSIQIGDLKIDEIELDLGKKTPSIYTYSGSERLVHGFIYVPEITFDQCAIVIQRTGISERTIVLCNMTENEAKDLKTKYFRK